MRNIHTTRINRLKCIIENIIIFQMNEFSNDTYKKLKIAKTSVSERGIMF